jgi:hypothetical protein
MPHEQVLLSYAEEDLIQRRKRIWDLLTVLSLAATLFLLSYPVLKVLRQLNAYYMTHYTFQDAVVFVPDNGWVFLPFIFLFILSLMVPCCLLLMKIFTWRHFYLYIVYQERSERISYRRISRLFFSLFFPLSLVCLFFIFPQGLAMNETRIRIFGMFSNAAQNFTVEESNISSWVECTNKSGGRHYRKLYSVYVNSEGVFNSGDFELITADSAHMLDRILAKSPLPPDTTECR